MSMIEKSWYHPFGVSWLLLPLLPIFWLIAKLRRIAYQTGLLKVYRAPVPVVVVGNISVGGNGKTPMVLWLVDYFQQQGKQVGVVSRGYGGQLKGPLLVTSSHSPADVGDEPALIVKRTQVPLAIGAKRADAIKLLTAKYPELDVVISDDGMQHYAMARDVEICIVDAKRQFGNGMLMPVGPLRETKARIKSTDCVIYNGEHSGDYYTLKTTGFFNVADDQAATESITAAHAISAIGNPERFEASVEALGVTLTSRHHFSDHHAYTPEDLSLFSDDPVVMTEKDAVKCHGFAKSRWYYLKVDACLSKATQTRLHSLFQQKGIL